MSPRSRSLPTIQRQWIYAGVSLTCALAFSTASYAHLRQVNPIAKAPRGAFGAAGVINDTLHQNEYPWLSNDGRLLIWTKQCNEEGEGLCDGDAHPHARTIHTNSQWLWVARIDQPTINALKGAAPGASLPLLGFDGRPTGLEAINHFFIDEANRVGKDLTIKSFAICEESPQPQRLSGRDRYVLTLFLAVGEAPPVGVSDDDDNDSRPRQIWRAHRLVVVVKDSGQITTSIAPSRIGLVRGTDDVPGKNKTEPMVTRDGRYLLWASNAFNGDVARYMASSSACDQRSGPTSSYAQLPASDPFQQQTAFDWKDQYLDVMPAFATSNTNYHTLVERPSGQTAMIFENGHGKVGCKAGKPYVGDPSDPCATANAQNRDCVFKCHKDHLWTTGFESNATPQLITNWSSGPLNRPNVRVSHPAIAGPRIEAQNSWILFFMRGKKIWYTKIAEE